MEFRFTDEQKMIRETAESFLQDVSTSEAVRKAMATDTGYDTELWQRICTELCFQAITIPEQHGGMGLGYVELAAVLEQMGRVLLCAPFLFHCLSWCECIVDRGNRSATSRILAANC
jgi:alkylation response protein AidB-like acyl-CoA dehydrogenase